MPAPKKKASADSIKKDKAAKSAPPLSNAQKALNKLAKLGLRTDMDLALHLPLRYEDETQVMSIHDASLRGTQVVQVEGVVSKSDVQFRPRRQLVVTIADDSGPLVMRFLNFYGSQATQLAEGVRVRVRGELRHGFFGAEMVHPTYKVVLEGAPLPTALTPVYPAGEGLSQAYLRKAIAGALSRLDWRDTLQYPEEAVYLPPRFRGRIVLTRSPDSLRTSYAATVEQLEALDQLVQQPNCPLT